MHISEISKSVEKEPLPPVATGATFTLHRLISPPKLSTHLKHKAVFVCLIASLHT